VPCDIYGTVCVLTGQHWDTRIILVTSISLMEVGQIDSDSWYGTVVIKLINIPGVFPALT